MAYMVTSMAALFLVLNLVFSTAISARNVDCPPTTKPKARPSPSTPTACPRDALKLGVCANVLNGLVNVTVGMPPKQPCCSLIQGLADVEAAVCLCTAIKANILGLNLNIPISLSLLLNHCGSDVPRGFQCA